MNVDGRVTMVMGEDSEGRPMVGIEFPDVSIIVDPSMVAYIDGKLTVAVPATIDLPTDCVVVERWLPPETDQVFMAIEGVSDVTVERLLIEEQMTDMGTPMGTLAKRAVARAVMGEPVAD